MKFISRKEYSVLAGLFLAAATVSPARVQGQLAVYNFNSTTTPLAPSTVGSGITAGNISFNSITGYSWFWSEPSGLGVLQLNPGTGVNTAAEAISSSMDFSFTLSSATPMNLSSLTLDGAVGAPWDAPAGYAVESSVDGYSSILSTANFTAVQPTFATYTINLTGAAFQGLSTITFQIYGYTANYGYEEFDNITVNSTVVPEPSALAMAGIGMAALVRLMASRCRN